MRLSWSVVLDEEPGAKGRPWRVGAIDRDCCEKRTNRGYLIPRFHDRKLADMRAPCFNEHRVERLAATHKETVTLGAPETNVCANFREANLANAIAVRCENVHSVIAVAHPAGTGPDVPVLITTNPIRKT